MKKKIIVIMLTFAMVSTLCLTGCGGSSGSNDETYQVKIAHVLSETDDVHLGFEELKKMLEEESDGRLQVEIYGNAALSATDEETVELVNTDAVQMACVGIFSLANIGESLEKLSVLDLPYLFETDEDYYKFLDSDYGAAMLDEVLQETGNVWATTSYVRSWDCLTTTSKPVHVPSDAKGMSVLTQSPKVFVETAESWGANVATVPFAEAYTAMQQGTVDGHLRPINLSISQRFYEVQDYATLINQAAMANTTLISQSWYDSLPSDLQEIVKNCLEEYQKIMREYGKTRQTESVEQMAENGVEIIELTDAEKDQWIEASQSVYDAMEGSIGQDVINEARKILGR